MLEDSFDRSNGKPIFHANAVLAQISREVHTPPSSRDCVARECLRREATPLPFSFIEAPYVQIATSSLGEREARNTYDEPGGAPGRRAVEPQGQNPCLHAEVRFGTQAWHLTNAQVGRHPGQKFAHRSMAKGRGSVLSGPDGQFLPIFFNFAQFLFLGIRENILKSEGKNCSFCGT